MERQNQMDLNSPPHIAAWLKRLDFDSEEWRRKGWLRDLEETISISPMEIEVRGKRLLQFASDDPLCLNWDPRILESVARSLTTTSSKRFGTGASPLVLAQSPELTQLESRLAQFINAEQTLVLNSEYDAGFAALSSLILPQDVVFASTTNHQSLIDGVQISGAKTHLFSDAKAGHLKSLLQLHRASGVAAYIVVSTISRLEGRVASLEEIASLSEEYNAIPIVDESYALGLFGSRGNGIIDELQLRNRLPIQIGSLSHGIGCMGGFVSGPKPVVRQLVNHAKNWMDSVSMPLPLVIACQTAIDCAESMVEERARLRTRSTELRKALLSRGWSVPMGESHIIPIRFSTSRLAFTMHERLLERGIYASPIRPPTVPEGQSLLRLCINIHHTEEHTKRLLDTLADIG